MGLTAGVREFEYQHQKFENSSIMLERFRVPDKDRVYVKEDRIRFATEALFRKVGLDDKGARASADVLIKTDLFGVESHGVSNMLRRYIERYQAGSVNPRPRPRIVRETATTANVNGDGGLGIDIGADMMGMAIDKARQYGMGAVTVTHTGHVGACGYFALLAAEADMIGICMTGGFAGDNATHGMVPTFGAQTRLGTNPIAWAAPARNRAPFLFDVATTQVAGNKLFIAERLKAELDPAWIARTDGTPILEKGPVPEKYFMLPFGGTRENGSHKGYGFAVISAIMCQMLSGSGLKRKGTKWEGGHHFFAAYQIEAFCDPEEFKDNLDEALDRLANTKPAPGHERVIYPGQDEGEELIKRRREGIPYHQEVIDWFHEIGKELDVSIDLP